MNTANTTEAVHIDTHAPVQPLSERDLDRAILRHRAHYDRAVCNRDWFSDAELAAEMAEWDRLDAEAKAWMKSARRRLVGTVAVLLAMLAAGAWGTWS